jgi:hypothetical protein
MRKLFAIALLALSVSAFAGHPTFNFTDAATTAGGVHSMDLYPIGAPWTNGAGVIIIRDWVSRSTAASGTVVISNIYGGPYRGEFHGPKTTTTNYYNFPVTNIVYNAADYAGAPTNYMGILAYSKAQADAIFWAMSVLVPGVNTSFRTNNGQVFIDSSGGGSGSQTPLIQPVNGNNQTITNLSTVQSTNFVGNAVGLTNLNPQVQDVLAVVSDSRWDLNGTPGNDSWVQLVQRDPNFYSKYSIIDLAKSGQSFSSALASLSTFGPIATNQSYAHKTVLIMLYYNDSALPLDTTKTNALIFLDYWKTNGWRRIVCTDPGPIGTANLLNFNAWLTTTAAGAYDYCWNLATNTPLTYQDGIHNDAAFARILETNFTATVLPQLTSGLRPLVVAPPSFFGPMNIWGNPTTPGFGVAINSHGLIRIFDHSPLAWIGTLPGFTNYPLTTIDTTSLDSFRIRTFSADRLIIDQQGWEYHGTNENFSFTSYPYSFAKPSALGSSNIFGIFDGNGGPLIFGVHTDRVETRKDLTVGGTVNATNGFIGDGSLLTSLPASQLTGTIPAARMPAFTGDITTTAGAVATTLKNTGTAGTYTKTTFDAQGRETSGASAQLASADFANQGTTSTLLHGNAAGNPSFGAVALGSEVSGSLPLANGGAGAALTDPNANTFFFWDDTDNAFKFVTLGSGFTYDHASHTVSVSSGGGGTVTATGGALTANAAVLGAGSTDTKVVPGIISDAASKWILGVAGSLAGGIDFKNATSGTLTLKPATGALGTVSSTFPASDTFIPVISQLLTISGMTAARTMTIPDANFTAARTDAGNTFTGHQTIEGVTSTGATGTGKFVFDGSPTLVTPTLGVATGTRLGLGVAADATFEFIAEADNLGVTANHGVFIKNGQAASAGAQQVSPVIKIEGQGWKTTATAGSQAVDFSLGVIPVQGTANPTGLFVISNSINGGNWAESMRVDSSGNLFAGGTLDLAATTDTTISRSAAGEISVEGVPVLTTTSTATVQNKTIDSANNVIKLKGYIQLKNFDNITGAKPNNTNDYTASTFMKPVFLNGTAATANFIQFQIQVPTDFDTSVDPKIKITDKLTAADTGVRRYIVSTISPAASAAYDGTVGTAINVDIAADASGASGDVEQSSQTTLTGWGAALTPGRHWVIQIGRDGNSGTDTSTVDSMFSVAELEYGVTQ